MTNYIIQVVIYQLSFLLLYESLLKKDTFFNLNRWYLLLTPVLALIIPFIRIDLLTNLIISEEIQNFTANNIVALPEILIGGPREVMIPEVVVMEQPKENFNWPPVLYIVGTLLAMLFFLYRFSNLIKSTAIAKKKQLDSVWFYEIPNSDTAFTFLNRLYLGSELMEAERKQIITHEMVHVKSKHTIDLLIFEFLRIILWFNPVIYIFQKRIEAVHEFIADRETVRTSGKKEYFEQLLNSAFGTQNFSFVNQFFNHSLIKKRIVMLQKNTSNKFAGLKFLMLIPLLGIMLTYVACSEDRSGIMEEELSLEEKILMLEAEIKSKTEPITTAEANAISKLRSAADNKQEIIEVVEVQGYGKEDIDMPYAIIEQVPAFPGCEGDNQALKDCTTNKITEYVNKNFDTSLGKKLGLSGVNRVIVQFKINTEGNIVDIKTRSSEPELGDEAVRVIKGLPKLQPGLQDGKRVNVMYSLPIVFQVSE